MLLVISAAAVMHLILLSPLTFIPILFLSALKIAAWCRQIVALCMHMLTKTMFGSAIPAGSLRWSGKLREVLSRILSRFRCRFQNSPFKSPSRSFASGRCRCVRFLPKRQASSITPENGESDERLVALLIESSSEAV